MSRVLLVALDEARVVAACRTENVGISVIEPLLTGGVRLVCNSNSGAERMTRKFKSHLIAGEVKRERYRPSTPLW